uniref:Uncharacterized protein n=1 Tax=Photinus pyralis TaxID=7054 RepID=A0A1Y1N9Y8_PHOPY
MNTVPYEDSEVYFSLRSLEHVLNNRHETFEHKVESLVEVWKQVQDCRLTEHKQYVMHLMDWLKLHTLNIVLTGEWKKHKEIYEERLLKEVNHCEIILRHSNNIFSLRCKKLAEIIKDPWGNPILNRLLNTPDQQIGPEEMDFFGMETGYLISTRLRKLCESHCEDLALNLVTAFMRFHEMAEQQNYTINATDDQKRFILDVYIALLYKYKRTRLIVSTLKSLSLSEGLELLKRFAHKRVNISKIWRQSGRIAALAANVYMTAAVMKVPDESAHILEGLLVTWLDMPEIVENLPSVTNTVRRVMQAADSAIHMYTLCNAFYTRFGARMRTFVIELYIMALTTDINVLQRQKEEKNTAAESESSERLSCGFLKLADVIDHNIRLCRESVLTAFSLNPSQEILDRIVSLANATGYEVVTPVHLWKCDHPPSDSSDEVSYKCSLCGDYKCHIELQSSLKSNTALSDAVQAETDLSCHLRDDLVVVLSSPRYHFLNWLGTWKNLYQLCVMYLADPDKVKNIITDLKFVDIDYSRFLGIKREPEDENANGIERGYEHYLEESYPEAAETDNESFSQELSPSHLGNENFEAISPQSSRSDPEVLKSLRLFRPNLKRPKNNYHEYMPPSKVFIQNQSEYDPFAIYAQNLSQPSTSNAFAQPSQFLTAEQLQTRQMYEYLSKDPKINRTLQLQALLTANYARNAERDGVLNLSTKDHAPIDLSKQAEMYNYYLMNRSVTAAHKRSTSDSIPGTSGNIYHHNRETSSSSSENSPVKRRLPKHSNAGGSTSNSQSSSSGILHANSARRYKQGYSRKKEKESNYDSDPSFYEQVISHVRNDVSQLAKLDSSSEDIFSGTDSHQDVQKDSLLLALEERRKLELMNLLWNPPDPIQHPVISNFHKIMCDALLGKFDPGQGDSLYRQPYSGDSLSQLATLNRYQNDFAKLIDSRKKQIAGLSATLNNANNSGTILIASSPETLCPDEHALKIKSWKRDYFVYGRPFEPSLTHFEEASIEERMWTYREFSRSYRQSDRNSNRRKGSRSSDEPIVISSQSSISSQGHGRSRHKKKGDRQTQVLSKTPSRKSDVSQSTSSSQSTNFGDGKSTSYNSPSRLFDISNHTPNNSETENLLEEYHEGRSGESDLASQFSTENEHYLGINVKERTPIWTAWSSSDALSSSSKEQSEIYPLNRKDETWPTTASINSDDHLLPPIADSADKTSPLNAIINTIITNSLSSNEPVDCDKWSPEGNERNTTVNSDKGSSESNKQSTSQTTGSGGQSGSQGSGQSVSKVYDGSGSIQHSSTTTSDWEPGSQDSKQNTTTSTDTDKRTSGSQETVESRSTTDVSSISIPESTGSETRKTTTGSKTRKITTGSETSMTSTTESEINKSTSGSQSSRGGSSVTANSECMYRFQQCKTITTDSDKSEGSEINETMNTSQDSQQHNMTVHSEWIPGSQDSVGSKTTTSDSDKWSRGSEESGESKTTTSVSGEWTASSEGSEVSKTTIDSDAETGTSQESQETTKTAIRGAWQGRKQNKAATNRSQESEDANTTTTTSESGSQGSEATDTTTTTESDDSGQNKTTNTDNSTNSSRTTSNDSSSHPNGSDSSSHNSSNKSTDSSQKTKDSPGTYSASSYRDSSDNESPSMNNSLHDRSSNFGEEQTSPVSLKNTLNPRESYYGLLQNQKFNFEDERCASPSVPPKDYFDESYRISASEHNASTDSIRYTRSENGHYQEVTQSEICLTSVPTDRYDDSSSQDTRDSQDQTSDGEDIGSRKRILFLKTGKKRKSKCLVTNTDDSVLEVSSSSDGLQPDRKRSKNDDPKIPNWRNILKNIPLITDIQNFDDNYRSFCGEDSNEQGVSETNVNRSEFKMASNRRKKISKTKDSPQTLAHKSAKQERTKAEHDWIKKYKLKEVRVMLQPLTYSDYKQEEYNGQRTSKPKTRSGLKKTIKKSENMTTEKFRAKNVICVNSDTKPWPLQDISPKVNCCTELKSNVETVEKSDITAMNPCVVLKRLEFDKKRSASSVLAHVPGLNDLQLIRPSSVDRIVQVVQVPGARSIGNVPVPNAQTSTQVTPHIQRIGQPRTEKPLASDSDSTTATTSATTTNAASESPTLINILSQQIIRPATQNNCVKPRASPLINILSQQIIKPAAAVSNSKVTSSSSTTDTQVNSIPRVISGGDQIINQLINQVRTPAPTLKTLVSSPGTEQNRILQFICKSSDGKLIPVTSFTSNKVVKVSMTQTGNASVSGTVGTEDNSGKVAQNTFKAKSDVPEGLDMLPKFQQAFGKPTYQNNVDSAESTGSNNETINSDTEKPTTVKNQPKNSPASLNVQPVQGGVIYTRQVPVGQTINLIPPGRGQVFRIATSNPEQLSLVKDSVIQGKMSALLAAALQGKQRPAENSETDANSEDDSQSSTRVTLTTRNPLVQNARIIKPVLQIPSNVIRSAPQSNLSSTTLEQLREFDMVYKQVKERSSTNVPTESSPQSDSNDTPQQISVTYLNQGQKINCAPVVVVSSYCNVQPAASPALSVTSQGSSSPCVTPAPTLTLSSKASTKSPKAKAVKSTTTHTAKASPIPKPQQKPQEDEHTTQRIFDILAEYAEQLRNSPDLNNKPAPRRRSNPPTNPSQNTKRKKSSSSKKTGQSSNSLASDADIDDGHTVGSEDSSCGVVQISVQDDEQALAPVNTSESSEASASPKQLILTDSAPNQSHSLIIADSNVGEALKMSNTAVLVPGNYIMPVSMVKGGQQIAVVSGGSKILATVPARSGPNMLLFQSFLNQTRKHGLPTVKYSTIQPISGMTRNLSGIPAQATTTVPATSSQNLTTVTLSPSVGIQKVSQMERVDNFDTTEVYLAISQPQDVKLSDHPQSEHCITSTSKANSDTITSEGSYKEDRKEVSSSSVATSVIAQATITKEEIVEVQSTTPGTMMALNLNTSDNEKDTTLKVEGRVQSVLVTTGTSNGPMLSHNPPTYKQVHSINSISESNKDEYLRTEGKHNSVEAKSLPGNVGYHYQTKIRKTHIGSQTRDRDLNQQLTLQRKAAMERELRLQTTLSEECEDLGVDEPSASDLFPEADLPFDSNHSPSFDQTSQDLVKRVPVVQEVKEETRTIGLFL